MWADLASNYVFCVGFCGWFLAQFLKIFTKRYKTGVWDARAFFDSGGMPSSHSALCSSVTTAIAMQQGLGSPLFAVAVCFRHAHAGHARCHPVLCYANCPGGAEQHWQATTGAPHQQWLAWPFPHSSALPSLPLLSCSVIVMYDAMGIRRHAGLQAELLNVVVGEVLEGHPMSARKLKEVLGHTPRQVGGWGGRQGARCEDPAACSLWEPNRRDACACMDGCHALCEGPACQLPLSGSAGVCRHGAGHTRGPAVPHFERNCSSLKHHLAGTRSQAPVVQRHYLFHKDKHSCRT